MSKRTKAVHDPAGSAIDRLPAAIETIRNAYQAHIEFANTVRGAVDIALASDDPKMAQIAIQHISKALDEIAT